MVGAYLESKDYAVDYAPDGVSGLRLGENNDYDAIVLDVMLPGIDGLDVCRRLRQESRNDVPVLMLTARDTLSDKLSGFEHGADDYLVKPFRLGRTRSAAHGVDSPTHTFDFQRSFRRCWSKLRRHHPERNPRWGRTYGKPNRPEDTGPTHASIAVRSPASRYRARNLG